MGDILPYTCIFEGCPETNTFYMSKETWLSHMEKEHWGIEQWECRACSQKNIYVTFRESSHFTAHIEQQHSKGIKPQQIPMLRLAWRRKVPLKVSACPLCCFESDDQNALLDHTAEHIHSFSLKSLPWAPREGFEGNDDKGEGDEEEEFGSFFNQHSYFDVDSCRSEVLSTSSGGSALATKPGSIAGSDSRAPANSIYEEQKQQLTEDLLEQVPHEILGQSGTGDWLQILDNDPEEPNPLPMPYDPDSPPISATDEKVLPDESISTSAKMMELRLDRRANEATITEEAVKAAGNEYNGREIMALLLDQRGDEINITEEVVKAAAGNRMTGKEVMALLLERRGDDITITEEVVKAAAENEMAGKEIMELILDQRHPNNLVIRDADYFDVACQKLCQFVQQWVLRFSKHSDYGHCRALGELDEKMADRFENAVLDGSDVEAYLSDRVRRRDVFMSVTMTMVWEFIFTRYLFGMDRNQRQKLKSLEKQLAEVVPCSAVNRWRATSLSLQSQLPAFATQCQSETEAVVLEIFGTLSHILPPPLEVETQLIESLRKVLHFAVTLSLEMRTQLADFIMLPPLQPEYDINGDLVRQIYFTSSLMNERSGETSSNEKLDEEKAVVRIVLFPLVIKKGDDAGEGDVEVVICPAQVIVAPAGKDNHVSKMMDVSCMSPDDQQLVHSTASSEAPPSPVLDISNMI